MKYLLILLCFEAYGVKVSDQKAFDWLSLKHGRFKQLYWTTDNNKLNGFVPSGEFHSKTKIGNYEIQLRHGVYFSNEENQDTSKDKPASAIVLNTGKIIFGGKGYKFFVIKNPKTKKKPLFILRYWSGVMGCSFTDFNFFEDPNKKPVIDYRSTKTTEDDRIGYICK